MANDQQKKEIKIELSPEVSAGHYSNLAMIQHSDNEFFIDFIVMGPGAPARVQSRIVMTPENMKKLMFAIRENVVNYEKKFGEIRPKTAQNGGGNNDIPNPFQA